MPGGTIVYYFYRMNARYEFVTSTVSIDEKSLERKTLARDSKFLL
jgi:hypothetical protein